MRIAHLPDCHLGHRRYPRRDARVNPREDDVARAFQAMIGQVIEARPDLVLFPGDLFDKVRPSNLSLLFACQQVQRLRAALPEVPVVAIGGNHDQPSASGEGAALALFGLFGCQVVLDRAEWLDFPALDLELLAVPECVLEGPEPPVLVPRGERRHRVLLAHGEVPAIQRGRNRRVAAIQPDQLGDWSYVALGHYHVQRQVGERCWYAGALEYVSSDPWGELREEAGAGKGWLLADLDTGTVERRPVPLRRQHFDLPVIDAADMTAAELDAALQANLPAVVEGQVIRQVVTNVAPEVKRGLDHRALARLQATALAYQLDLRRPEPTVTVLGVPVRSRGKGIEEILAEALATRPLPEGVDREAFVAAGAALMAGGEAA